MLLRQELSLTFAGKTQKSQEQVTWQRCKHQFPVPFDVDARQPKRWVEALQVVTYFYENTELVQLHPPPAPPPPLPPLVPSIRPSDFTETAVIERQGAAPDDLMCG
ncbi:hypothetical protein E2C01_031337 [Portunus trituberculatus]|uniref:Uncharacterized protein n=1 Tax=Portunus trituberculatus TaxID=210409 RepID=A0A5B7EYA9_PORTR|nr:hypothetical protein [Portunus trituberculatus]